MFIYILFKDILMIKRSLLIVFLVFTLLTSNIGALRLSMHFEDEAKTTETSTTTTTTTETGSKAEDKPADPAPAA